MKFASAILLAATASAFGGPYGGFRGGPVHGNTHIGTLAGHPQSHHGVISRGPLLPRTQHGHQLHHGGPIRSHGGPQFHGPVHRPSGPHGHPGHGRIGHGGHGGPPPSRQIVYSGRDLQILGGNRQSHFSPVAKYGPPMPRYHGHIPHHGHTEHEEPEEPKQEEHEPMHHPQHPPMHPPQHPQHHPAYHPPHHAPPQEPEKPQINEHLPPKVPEGYGSYGGYNPFKPKEDLASAQELSDLADKVGDLECSAPLYDYFHVNEIPDGEGAMQISVSAGAQVPFEICVDAGQTLDLEFQLSTRNLVDVNGDNTKTLVQLTANDMVLAEASSNSDHSSTTLLFRGKVTENTLFQVELSAVGGAGGAI